MTSHRRHASARLALGTLAVSITAGCTFSDGSGFATLRTATLRAELGSDAPLASQDGLDVELERATLGLEHVLLLGELLTDRPIEEEVVCDGDHCHAADGTLIAAGESDPATSDDAPAVIAEFETETDADLLEGTPVDLGAPEPTRELPAGHIAEVEVEVSHLLLEGTATGAPLGPTSVPLRIDLPLHGVALHGEVSRELSRDTSPTIDLRLAVTVPADLLSEVDLADLVASGAIELDEESPNAETIAGLLEAALRQSTLDTEL